MFGYGPLSFKRFTADDWFCFPAAEPIAEDLPAHIAVATDFAFHEEIESVKVLATGEGWLCFLLRGAKIMERWEKQGNPLITPCGLTLPITTHQLHTAGFEVTFIAPELQ